MTACLQKHSFLEKHYKIAGAALSFPTEDLTIRQRSQVSQILFPKAICCNHLAIQLIHQWQLDTGQRYNHLTNRLAAGRLGVTLLFLLRPEDLYSGRGVAVTPHASMPQIFPCTYAP